MEIYDFKVKTPEGGELALSDFRGKVMVIVNTASECGFTPQLEELEFLWKKYASRGLMLLAFPSDEFHQEPGSDSEIQAFCSSRYGVTFPVLAKVQLSGPNACPLFSYLAQQKEFSGFSMEHPIGPKLDEKLSKQDKDYAEKPGIKWNFTKFVVDRQGKVVARLEPTAQIEELEVLVQTLVEHEPAVADTAVRS